MTDSTLEHFSKTLHEAAKLSGTTVYTITRPIYLNMCEALNLNGWTKEQIQAYGKGWSGLRKDALKELKNHVEDKSIFAIKKEPVTEEPSNESNEDTGSDFINGIQNERDALLSAYNRFVKTYKYAPNWATFRNYYGSIPKYIYNNIFELDEDYRCLFNSDAEQNLFDRHSWTEEYQKAFREEVKKHKTFVLTSIGSFCDVDWDFIHSLENYAKENNSKVLVYRFPNLFGKWCRPNYNSVIATWCYNYANDLDIQVNDPSVELELAYIDDVVKELIDTLEEKEHIEDNYCYIPITHKVTLGRIVEILDSFKRQPETLVIPEIPNDSFEKKLYSTYLSYLPESKVKFELKTNIDDRGRFTELLKTNNNGQFSVNISKPGITKGQHWHHSKWEFFMVVKGHALIQERKIGTDEIIEFDVSGDKIEAVHMLPGYTHNIINLSDTEELITLMWANELFDPNHPDTSGEAV